ncbi:glutathione S-transferase family protein [Sphingomonas sabuli]|uniref:Glutathione S-transferase family protein n=1 Tax=Sphingomonas sabuli TaxID=2764186 RepID=A0A7G9L4J8_9SPHN|nr:glutathione S-transferase family protein [Sphingomonas sabuli]
MILFGSSMSPFVRKVIAFAGEKGVALDVKPIGLGDPDPDFRKASPFGKIPAFTDGEFHLSDSSAIIHYLEAKHPDPPLIPDDPELRGRCIWFDEFADTIFAACGAKMFFNRIVAPMFMKRDGDSAVADAAERDELPRVLDYIESVAPEADGFLVGDSLTLADIAVASPFANLRHLGIDPDRQRWGKTMAFADRILDRPSFRPWYEKEAAFLTRVRGA